MSSQTKEASLHQRPLDFATLQLADDRIALLFIDALFKIPWGRSYFCRREAWERQEEYDEGFGVILSRLVGPSSKRDGVLGTQEAWDIAAKSIWDNLPECRGCRCGS